MLHLHHTPFMPPGTTLHVSNAGTTLHVCLLCPAPHLSMQPTQFALISRFAYNRVVKAQLQAAIAARTELLKGLAAFKDATAASLHRAATACQVLPSLGIMHAHLFQL